MPDAIQGRSRHVTTAAIALEEQCAATASAEAGALAAPAGSAPSGAAVAAPVHAARSRLMLGAILVVETGWLAVLGLFAYKLIA